MKKEGEGEVPTATARTNELSEKGKKNDFFTSGILQVTVFDQV